MIEGSEELKMVLELAASKGRKEAENEMLETQKKQLEEANTKLLRQLSQKDKLLKEKEKIIEEQRRRISDMEALVANQTCAAEGQKQVVYVSQYFLLDAPKTFSYVCTLNNSQRMFAGHLLLHTMADNTPKQVFDQVNEMTQLASDPTELHLTNHCSTANVGGRLV